MEIGARKRADYRNAWCINTELLDRFPVRIVYWRMQSVSSTGEAFYLVSSSRFRSTFVSMPATVPPFVYCHMVKSN